MTNKHIILDHLAQSKGLSRKDLVTFICINNGYDGHKQGYYGTAIQEWEREGYIQKVGKKWCIAPLGKTYLKNPKIATLKAKVVKLTKGMANWKDNYYELKDASASTIQSLREANFDADNSDEIHILESKLNTSRNNEMLMEEEANRWLNQNKDTRDLLVKAQSDNEQLRESVKYIGYERDELKLKANNLTTKYNELCIDYQEELEEKDALFAIKIKYIKVRDELSELKLKANNKALPYDKSLIILALETLREQCSDDNNQGQVDRINAEISEIKGCSRNTLTLQPPPSTDFGDFSRAELIKLIKGML